MGDGFGSVKTDLMPWNMKSVQDQRKELLELACAPRANRSELCRRFGISRKTLYKWLAVSSEGSEPKDRTRRPIRSPKRSSGEVEEQVVALREAHRWGGRKISRRLDDLGGPHVAPSTVTEILRRHELLDGPRSGHKRDHQRFEREHPNDLWQMDFKGHFGLNSGDRCHPFGCLDDCSRYCLDLKACSNERAVTVQDILTLVFQTYGLPNQILADNGGPWGARSSRQLTPLLIWLSQLGIQVIHGRPYHPQTQGKQERFHHSLQFEVLDRRGFADLSECQKAFDEFRHVYNTQRPHESHGLQTPARLYTLSPRAFPKGQLKDPDYDTEFFVRKVQYGGILHFKAAEFRVGKCLHGHLVGVKPANKDGTYNVYFGRSVVTQIDLRQNNQTQ